MSASIFYQSKLTAGCNIPKDLDLLCVLGTWTPVITYAPSNPRLPTRDHDDDI